MSMMPFMFWILLQIPADFTPVEGFADLDYTATPDRFGLLLVTGEDSTGNLDMAGDILDAVDSLPEGAVVELFVVSPDMAGHPDILALCTDFPGLPSTLVLVGHCGYIQLDPEFLTAEILDSWYTWGDPGSRRTGICNFCRRCNP
ncbi:MAG: hypothetical protein JXA64_01065 [Candidatus Fermentibacteraceae bacterium]|nr:hypothetical protein [Candidatus Fermentibacteraceae bacterium]MBN2607676.1 hypothetical protein [Candidatus Fermentibacteraceae bacterium]